MKKIFVCYILAALLLVGLIPMGVFAAEDHNVMLTAAQPGVEIQDDDIVWIKEASYDVENQRAESAWYGLDNTGGVFPEGSRLCIRWIDENSAPEEVGWYKLNVDINVDLKVKNTGCYSIWTVVDANNETINPVNPVSLYIQIPDDWDSSDIQAYYIGEGKDERVETERTNNVVSPDGSNDFIKLTVNHLEEPLLVAEKAPFAASVWTHYQPAVIIGIVLIVVIIAIILVRKKNESK